MSITVPDILDMFPTSSSQAYTVIDVTFSLPIFFFNHFWIQQGYLINSGTVT